MSVLTTTQRGESRNERGAALIEMALVTRCSSCFCSASGRVARAYNVKNTMDHAVREGARFGATVDPWDPTLTGAIQAVIEGRARGVGDSPGVDHRRLHRTRREGNDGCTIDGTDRVVGAPADQVVVNIIFEDYRLELHLLLSTVDFTSQAIARHES
jgi:hypothetical protein